MYAIVTTFAKIRMNDRKIVLYIHDVVVASLRVKLSANHRERPGKSDAAAKIDNTVMNARTLWHYKPSHVYY